MPAPSVRLRGRRCVACPATGRRLGVSAPFAALARGTRQDGNEVLGVRAAPAGDLVPAASAVNRSRPRLATAPSPRMGAAGTWCSGFLDVSRGRRGCPCPRPRIACFRDVSRGSGRLPAVMTRPAPGERRCRPASRGLHPLCSVADQPAITGSSPRRADHAHRNRARPTAGRVIVREHQPPRHPADCRCSRSAGGIPDRSIVAATAAHQRVGRCSASGGWSSSCQGADAPAGGGPLGGTVSGITGRNKEGIDDRTAAGDRVELQSWRGG